MAEDVHGLSFESCLMNRIFCYYFLINAIYEVIDLQKDFNELKVDFFLMILISCAIKNVMLNWMESQSIKFD